MNRMLIAPLVALAAMLAFSFVSRADDAKTDAATGSVSVTVLDKDGKPVEGANVRVTIPKPKAGAPAADGKLADDSRTGDKTADKGKNPPVAEGKSDKDGKCTLDKVPAGDYNVTASVKGVGYAREKATVKAGETATVELKLGPPKQK